MIRRLVLLFVQRFLWKKLFKGSVKSKIWSVVSILFFVVVGGALFASFSFNMSFLEGVSWTWSLITGFSLQLLA